MTTEPQPNTPPLGAIGLSLSGGGGRAAGFHLGTMSYLSRLDLLKDVTILSTVSGGSFVGAAYTLALKEAPPNEPAPRTFDRFCREFSEFLLRAELMPWALERLAAGDIHVPSGRRTLVTALAQVYDDTFLHHQRFGIFWSDREIHIKELILNATEFKSGLAFRFQKSESPCRCGNGKVWISEEHAKKLRLADVVAASSCIPVGLEPLSLPGDFCWPDEEPELWRAVGAELKATAGAESIAIMDGGVYDNQGIESVLIAAKRAERHEHGLGELGRLTARRVGRWFHGLAAEDPALGLFIISDTPLRSDELYVAPPPAPQGHVTLQHVNLAAWLMLALAAGTMIVVSGHAEFFRADAKPLHTDIDDLFLYTVPFLLAAALAAALVWARRKVVQILKGFPQIGESVWQSVKKLTIDEVAQMIGLRLSSTWALTDSVYFNRIRQLNYSLIYALRALRHKILTQETFDLLVHDHARGLSPWLEPTQQMQQVAERAANLPTKLWFDNARELEDLIACGQMTMCYNMLAHLERHGAAYGYPANPRVRDLYERARADWERMKTDPYSLVNVPTAAGEPAAPAGA